MKAIPFIHRDYWIGKNHGICFNGRGEGHRVDPHRKLEDTMSEVSKNSEPSILKDETLAPDAESDSKRSPPATIEKKDPSC